MLSVVVIYQGRTWHGTSINCPPVISHARGCITGVLRREDGKEVRRLTSKLSSLGLNPDPAINYHLDVSKAGQFINVCVIPWMGIKPASICW